MSGKPDFVKQVLDAYSKMKSEIDRSASEYDVRHRIIKHIVEGLLGYTGKDYQAEKEKTDIKLLDESHSLVLVVVETKKPTVNIREEKWKDQAFGYSDAFTKHVVLTNGLQLMVWDKSKRDRPVIDLDFEAILEEKRLIAEKFTVQEKAQLSNLWELSRENLWSEKKYEDFTIPEKIDISTDNGFQKLMDKLHFVMNQLLMGYALRTFNEYIQGFKRYETELKGLEVEQQKTKGNRDIEARYEKEKRDLADRSERFLNFHRGYNQWLRLSGREDNEESKEIFCKETIYVLLNKLLLARICEDKGLVTKKLSNNGISRIRELFTYLKDSYKDLLDFAYRDISQLYSHVFERGIFDWYTEGNGELNKALNRVLYIFNHFDFGQVNRDILGKLYEKYLPKEERKRLGEFYTPDEVIDYILDAVGYSPDEEIEGKDLLDPACGSGGFLVRALNRLIDRYRMKGLGPKEMLNNVISHIYGFDINPFACHIAEMNLLFQVIDLYQKAKEEDRGYRLPRFNIYQTDSLEIPKVAEGLTRWQYPNSRVQKYIEEKETVERIKNKKFDFVVGNPPYVRIERLPKELRDYLIENYKSAVERFDLYMLFIERGISWLKDNGLFGFITSNKFIQRSTGSGIRRFIIESCEIQHFLDFGDSGVFRDVTNYPLISILVRRERIDKSHVFKYVEALKPREDLLTKVRELESKDRYSDNYIRLFKVRQSSLQDTWRFMPEQEMEVYEKIRTSAKQTLGDLCEDVRRGVVTGGNDVFIVGPETIAKYSLEKELLKPILRGEDLKRWRIFWGETFLVYPYTRQAGKNQLIDLSNYPRAKKYFEDNREYLEKRYSVSKLGKTWYGLHDPVDFDTFERDFKIIAPEMATSNSFVADNSRFWTLERCFIVNPHPDKVDVKYLLGLLNSKVLEFSGKHLAPFLSGRYYEYKTIYVKQFPIKLPETPQEKKVADEIRDLVDRILGLNAKLHENENARRDFSSLLGKMENIRLDDYPSVVLSISSNKIAQIRREGSKVFLNLTDHIECKDEIVARYVELYLRSMENKLRKTEDIKKEICGVRIPKSKQDLQKVLEQYEGTEKEIRDIPDKIKSLQSEIDQRVYKLYALSKDDIQVIEESIG